MDEWVTVERMRSMPTSLYPHMDLYNPNFLTSYSLESCVFPDLPLSL